MWRLHLASQELARRSRVSGRVLEIWLGHVVNAFCLIRPALSVLFRCYQFVRAYPDRRAPLWTSVRAEIRAASHLVFLASVDVSAKVFRRAYGGDASLGGFAFGYRDLDPAAGREFCRYHERWRFLDAEVDARTLLSAEAFDRAGGLSSLPEDSEWRRRLGPLAAEGSSSVLGMAPRRRPETQFEAWLNARWREEIEKERNRLRLGGRPSRAHPVRDKRERVAARSAVGQVGRVPRLPDALLAEATWTTVSEGHWRYPGEKIGVLEGRVALMSVRHLARDPASQGSMVLLLSDNLEVCMDFDRGRARGSAPMLVLCRRLAAYALAGRMRICTRYVESERNPFDEGSRRPVGGPPGEKPLPPPPGLPAPELPWRSRWPQRAALAAPRRATAGGTSRMRECILELPSQPARSARRAARRAFLELFAGSGRLSGAVQRLGVDTGPVMDLLHGPEFDLLLLPIQSLVLQWLEAGRIACVWLGTPCSIWSQARRNVRNVAAAEAKDAVGVACAVFSASVMQACLRLGIPFILENPQRSRLFEFPPVRDIVEDPRVSSVTFDACQYGAPYRKSTVLIGTVPRLHRLARRCCGGHHHIPLSGSVKIATSRGARYERLTQLAGEYTRPFARRSPVGAQGGGRARALRGRWPARGVARRAAQRSRRGPSCRS